MTSVIPNRSACAGMSFAGESFGWAQATTPAVYTRGLGLEAGSDHDRPKTDARGAPPRDPDLA